MKILCKKSITNSKTIFFQYEYPKEEEDITSHQKNYGRYEEGKYYEIMLSFTSGYKIESNADDFSSIYIDKESFDKYFYTPEETINIKRIKLIDKILNE